MKRYVMFAKKGCPYCEKSYAILDKNKTNFKVYYAEVDFSNKAFKEKFSDSPTYPKIYVFINKDKISLIKSSDELEELFN